MVATVALLAGTSRGRSAGRRSSLNLSELFLRDQILEQNCHPLESIELTGCGGLREWLSHVVQEYRINVIEFSVVTGNRNTPQTGALGVML